MDASAFVTLLELEALQCPSTASLGPIRAFHQVVQLPKNKSAEGLIEDKAHTIAKGKGKEKEQEQKLSVVVDKQLVILFQHLCDARVLKEVDAGVLENPIVQLLSRLKTRASVLLYSEDYVPQSDDCMDKLEDLSFLAAPGPSSIHVPRGQGALGPLFKKAKAESNKPIASVPVEFFCNVLQGADERLVKVHGLLNYTFPLAYAVPVPLVNCSNLNDKEVIIAVLTQEAGWKDEEDDRDDEYASKYEYREIKVDSNMKTCCLKKAHNEKVDQKEVDLQNK
ncbi:hypothetical protein C0995_007553 [Termitomyces sp. Mi166|nr:hypothetical protein C0995_007553 [Termitomyces sp. Mi166\